MKTLVLGLGNLLLCDEGIGVHTAQALLEGGCPDDVTVLDVGTAILDALEAIEEADRIIVVDAVKADMEPGTVYRMPFEDFERAACIASMHGFDLSRVLYLAQKKEMPEVVVIGIEPSRIDWSMELSPEVQRVLPSVVEAVRQEIAAPFPA
ncbi:MAG: hydrogenase maturation protease [Acidobacteriota bacterium]